MKTKVLIFALVAVAAIVLAFNLLSSQTDEPWAAGQLMEPSVLAGILNSPNAKKPVVLSIGFEADIKGSVELGPASEEEGIKKLKEKLEKLSKEEDIVIYCGCCPFKHCPNVRPAFKLLNKMGFKNHKLLNLAENLKVDWIDKGYPTK